jgi:hypothetical protein
MEFFEVPLIDIAKAGGSIQISVAVLDELCTTAAINTLAAAVGDHPAAKLTLHSDPDHLLSASLMTSVSKTEEGKATFVFD